MSFVVKEVELSNIRSHGHIVFNPATEGVTALLGKNGTGKSSIIDSVAWTLFGTKIGGMKNSAIMKSGVDYKKGEFFAKVTIAIDGQELLVERKFVSKAGTVEADVYAIVDDDGSDDEAAEIEREAKISDFFDGTDDDGSDEAELSFDDFDDNEFVGDDDEDTESAGAEGSAEEGEGETKKKLVHLAGPGVSHAERYIRQRLGMDERGFLSSVLVQQKQVDQLISASARERAGVIEDLTGITALTRALDESRKEYNALKKASTVSSADAEGIQEGERKSKELRKHGNAIKQDLLDRKAELKVLSQQGTELREKHDRAVEARREREELESDLKIAESKYADVLTAKDEAVEERNELKGSLDGMTSSENAEAVIAERDSASEEVSTLNGSMSSLKTRADTARKNIANQESTVQRFFSTVLDENEESGRFLRERLSSELQEAEVSATDDDNDVIAHIEGISKQMTATKGAAEKDVQQAQQSVSSHQASIKSLSHAVEVLSHEDGTCPTCLQTVSDTAEAVAGLNKQIEQHQKEVETAQSNLEASQKVFDMADTIVSESSQALTALSDKADYLAELQKAEDEIEVVSGEYRVAKDKLDSLKKKADKASSVLYRTDEYQRALNRAQKLSREANELKIRTEGIREDLGRLKDVSVESVKKSEKALEKKREEYQRKDREMIERRGELSVIKEQLHSEERHLSKLREDYDKHQKLMKTLSVASSSVKIIEEFRTDQIENSVPVIENYASDFIARFTDSKFVKMELDTKFNASVLLADGTKRPVAALSGGELSSAAIALRLAVSMLLGGGSQSNSLLLDEILTAVDDERSDSILAAIKETVQGQVILISHSGHVNDFADKVFEL